MMIDSTPTDYFLKENNCISMEKHYYALVEANLLNTSMTQAQATGMVSRMV